MVRPSYELCWNRLGAIFASIAEIEEAPDPSLKYWEQLRRCPWALRQVIGTHVLGLPAGHRIPQVVLASNVFKNTKQGATEWFHEPASLLETCSAEQVRRRPKTFIQPDFTIKSAELDLFERHAPAMFRQIIGAEYPKFAGFETNQRGFRCYFHNGPDDQKPSSFCEGDRSRIMLQARQAFGSDGFMLEATPTQL